MDSTASTPQTPITPSVPLDVTDQQNTALLEDTLNLLSAGIPHQPDNHGIAEIERWEAVLQASTRPGLAKILQELGILREQLTTPGTESHTVAETIATLGSETIKVAEEIKDDYSSPLIQLGKTLIKISSSLSR